jgi:competence protein ComEC
VAQRFPASRLRAWNAVVATLLFGALLGAPSAAWGAGSLRLDFIDVGQGDAALITSPTGKTVLIDGGPRRSSRALAAFLAEHTHGPLDLVVLTHRHEDHLGGLTAAMQDVGARLFLDAPVAHPTRVYTRLLHVLEERGIPVRQAVRGRKIDLGGGATMTLVGPPDPAITGSRSDVNANSVVARVQFGSFVVLLAADAEAPTEAWLLASGGDLHATVLKVAHHGSRFASGARFLRAVAPKIAIVSVGASNDYGHPAPETLDRLARGGATIYRTDVDGDVAIETDGTAIKVHAAHGRQQAARTP